MRIQSRWEDPEEGTAIHSRPENFTDRGAAAGLPAGVGLYGGTSPRTSTAADKIPGMRRWAGLPFPRSNARMIRRVDAVMTEPVHWNHPESPLLKTCPTYMASISVPKRVGMLAQGMAPFLYYQC